MPLKWLFNDAEKGVASHIQVSVDNRLVVLRDSEDIGTIPASVQASVPRQIHHTTKCSSGSLAKNLPNSGAERCQKTIAAETLINTHVRLEGRHLCVGHSVPYVISLGWFPNLIDTIWHRHISLCWSAVQILSNMVTVSDKCKGCIFVSLTLTMNYREFLLLIPFRLFQLFSRVMIRSQPKVPGGFLPNAAKENVTVKAIGFLSH